MIVKSKSGGYFNIPDDVLKKYAVSQADLPKGEQWQDGDLADDELDAVAGGGGNAVMGVRG